MASLRIVIRDMEFFAGEATRVLGFEIWRAVRDATPVRTGFSAAKWSMSIANPIPGPSRPRGEAAQRGAARSLRASNRNRASAILRRKGPPRGEIAIVNNEEALRFLNDGSSSQAPAMFVERSIIQGRLQAIAKLQGRS